MGIIDKLHRIKWLQHSFTEATDFYEHIVVFPNFYSTIVGLDVFSRNHKDINWRVIAAFVMMFIYFLISGTTAYDMRNDPEGLIFCFATVGVAVQVGAKIITFVVFKKDLLWLHQYTLTLFKEEGSVRTKKLLMNNLFLLSVIIKAMLVSYIFTVFALDSAPLLVLAKTDEKLLPFGFYIPCIDRFSWSGYVVNYLLQILLSSMVSSGDTGPDCIYMILTMSCITQIDLMINSLKEMSRRIDDGVNFENDLQVIIKRHQEHLKYLRTVESIFRISFLITFVSLSLVLITTLFAVLMLSWYQGYVFILFVGYQLGFACFLGTLLAIKNEQLQREIYNISWLKLSAGDKKSLRFLLQGAQEPICLSLVFAPLNMPTLLSVYKTIYSTFTVFRMMVSDE